MGTPSFHEITRQASFFLKEKIKTARLALTDVTTVQLLTEDATNGDLSAPDTRTLGLISRAAFEVDDYWRIVDILHKRLSCFDRRNWRPSYKALIVLEHLLTHGPERVAEEFQSERDVLREKINFQYVDDKGYNWGLSVGKKSESILKMLEDVAFLKEERARARKVTSGIKGFGSFSHRSSSINGSFKELGRSKSLCNNGGNQKDEVLSHKNAISADRMAYEHRPLEPRKTAKNQSTRLRIGEVCSMEENHPFCQDEDQSGASLLS